jgi:hypothetical protein
MDDIVIENLECIDVRTDSPTIDYQRGGLKTITWALNEYYDISLKDEKKTNADLALELINHIHTCKEDECSVCSIVSCPHDEPLHHHHDGCPICDAK